MALDNNSINSSSQKSEIKIKSMSAESTMNSSHYLTDYVLILIYYIIIIILTSILSLLPLLLLTLLLLSSQIPVRIGMNPPSHLLVSHIQNPNNFSLLIHPRINHTTTIPKLLINPILNKQKLSHNKALQSPIHKIKR